MPSLLSVSTSESTPPLSTATVRRASGGTATRSTFFSYDPFHDEMQRAARRVPFAETTIPILSPEHLAVCKAMFDRPKDWLDIEQILVATDPLDLPEIEAWLEAMVGEDNPRLARLREILVRLKLR